MIIELKCENKNTNKGSVLKAPVEKDIQKAKELKSEYKAYTFKVVAMAYSVKAEQALEGIGMQAMSGIEQPQKSDLSSEDDVLKVYWKIVESASSDDGVDELTQGMDNLNTDDKKADKTKDKTKDKTSGTSADKSTSKTTDTKKTKVQKGSSSTSA